jgi:hypothetical protein
MLKTLKDQIQILVDIIKHYNNLQDEVYRRSIHHLTGDTYNALKYIKAENFDLFVKQLESIESVLNCGSSITNTEYLALLEKAEAKLAGLPFGSADWQRQYGFIEGLKEVEFYTKTDAV